MPITLSELVLSLIFVCFIRSYYHSQKSDGMPCAVQDTSGIFQQPHDHPCIFTVSYHYIKQPGFASSSIMLYQQHKLSNIRRYVKMLMNCK